LGLTFDCTIFLADARGADWATTPPLWRALATRAQVGAGGPVYAVVPDLTAPGAEWGKSFSRGQDRVTILHISAACDRESLADAHCLLRERGVMRPLVILANPALADLGVECFAARKVALVDAVPPPSADQIDVSLSQFSRYIAQSDLVCFSDVAVAQGMSESCALPARVLVAQLDDPNAAIDIMDALGHARASQPSDAARLNVLVLYDSYYRYVGTIRDYLQAFLYYSRHRFWFVNATNTARCLFDLSKFDVVFIHYSVRLCLPQHIAREFSEAVRRFGGLKLLCIQDEYDHVEMTRSWIKRLGIHVVFTCVPTREGIEKVYPSNEFPHTRFESVLTGYVAESAMEIPFGRPLAERKIAIGYRGRSLPYYYGDLGHEKLMIGQRARQLCEERGVPCDIEWTEDKRIYGRDWYRWLGSCRATLGSESGANVFDWDGTLRDRINCAVTADPNLTYQQAKARYLTGYEGQVRMGQVSPRVFEAIATRTALILFEGEYSGVVRPGEHFIPLKKDFSNFDEVLTKLRDDQFIHDLTSRAYRDVIGSGEYSYRAFVEMIDRVISEELPHSRGYYLCSVYNGFERDGATGQPFAFPDAIWQFPHESVSGQSEKRHVIEERSVAFAAGSMIWRALLPKRVRRVLFPHLERLLNAMRRIKASARSLLFPGAADTPLIVAENGLLFRASSKVWRTLLPKPIRKRLFPIVVAAPLGTWQRARAWIMRR